MCSQLLSRNWRTICLADIVEHNGIQTGPFGSRLHASDYTDTGIPVVMPKDMANSRISVVSISRIPEQLAGNLERHKLLAGDIVFARRGEIGRCALVSSEQEGWLCGTGSLRVRLDRQQALPEYLIHSLMLSGTVDWLVTNAVGQTMLNLSATVLSQLPLTLPPLPEQRKIAEILGTWDAAIGRVAQLIAALQRRKQGLMQRLLTGAVRFPEFGGTEWEECCIGDLLTETKRPLKLDPDEEYALASVRRRSEGLFFRENRQGRALTSSEMYEVHTGDFLISKRQIVHGASALVTPEFDGFFVSNSYHVLSARDRIDIRYFNWLSRTPLLYHYAYVASHGVHIEKLFFVLETYFRQRVVVPNSIDEQQKIAAVLDSADKQIQKYQLYLAQLQAQKKGLMQRLLTGQVRVKVDSVTPAA